MTFTAPGVERAHLQQAAHATRAAGGDQAVGEIDVGALEAVSAAAALVEDADQVDRGLCAVQQPAQIGRGVDVGGHHLDPGQHQQIALALAVAAGYRDREPAADQFGDQAAADEAGAAEYDDAGQAHEELPGRVVGQANGCRSAAAGRWPSARWAMGTARPSRRQS